MMKKNFWLHYTACRILVPWSDIKPAPPVVEAGVLTTGLQGTPCKSLELLLLNLLLSIILEKAMAPHSSTLAWKIPWMEEPDRLQSMGSLRVGHNWATSLHFSLSCIGGGNGNPLQCSCLENPRDGGAWWAAVYGSHRVGHDWSDLAVAAASIILFFMA